MTEFSLVSVGGTIASRIDYETGGVKALMTPKEILEMVPELKGVGRIKRVVQPFTRMSEDLTSSEWQEMAKVVAKELNSGVDGVIVTHGTDTLAMSSAALSFMLPELSGPVVFTGAQRSTDRGSTDAVVNLICSGKVCGEDIAEVGTCLHASTSDNVCWFIRGTKARKLHSSRRDAFQAVNDRALLTVPYIGRVEETNEFRRRKKSKVKVESKFNDNVSLLKAIPGSRPEVMELLVDQGIGGFVLEGTGLGHVPTAPGNGRSWLPAIADCVERGIPVVVCSSTLYGRVNKEVYSNLRRLYYEAGAWSGQDMLAETAMIKLGWVMGQTKKLSEVRELMERNLVGEIQDRHFSGDFGFLGGDHGLL